MVPVSSDGNSQSFKESPKCYDVIVRSSLLPFLACPDCLSDIELVQGDTAADDDIINGILECVRCHRTFLIQRRFPQMLPSSFDAELKREMAVWDTQVNAVDSNLLTLGFGIVEIPYLVHALDLDEDYTLLDAGCGVGRMTVQLAEQVKELVCVDFSVESLAETERKVRASTVRNVHYVLGDVCQLPLKGSRFSRALSSQVIEHLPTQTLRARAVSEIRRTVLPGSTIVVSAYQHSRLSREKSGEHDGGIHYMRFSEEELADLLRTSLDVKQISGLLIYLFVAICSRPL